jgi:hypothetical protein
MLAPSTRSNRLFVLLLAGSIGTSGCADVLFVTLAAAAKGAAGLEVGEPVETNQLVLPQPLPRVYGALLAVAPQRGRTVLSADATTHEVRISYDFSTLHTKSKGLLIVRCEPTSESQATLLRVIGGSRDGAANAKAIGAALIEDLEAQLDLPP